MGPTGVGKSFLASALAQKACRDGHLVLHTRASALFRDLGLARADGVCAISWLASAAWMSWRSTTGPWPCYKKPNATILGNLRGALA